MVRPRAKVTIDSLYEVVYEESIGTLTYVYSLVNHCVTFGIEYL